MKKKLVTVIMPYFRKKDFFQKSFNSAINQTYKKKEIIVIFDDRDVSELNFVKKVISKNKITKLIINSKNKGVSYSRNIGIKKAAGEYIAFLDCDDIWKKQKLEKQIKFMLKNKFLISHTAYEYINSKDKVVGEFILNHNLNYKSLLKSCDIGLSTVVVKKNILGTNPFQNISSKEDYVLWLKLIKKYSFGYLPNKLSKWRKLKNSLSGNFVKKISNGFLVYRKFENLGIASSIMKLIMLSYYSLRK